MLPGAAYITVVPFADVVAPQYRAWRSGATVFAAFGVLALVLAALGLYSLVAYGPAVWAAVAAALALVAALASLLPGWRATLADPTDALRAE